MSNSKKQKEEDVYFRLDKILTKHAQYNMVIGERSNGKTYAALEYGLKKWYESGYVEQTAYLRRWKEDFRKKRADVLFAGHVANDLISKITKGEWNNVKHLSGRWYLCYHSDELDQDIVQEEPFCYAFALSEMEHDKSTSYPNVTTVVFDEFITRSAMLGDDEFVTFCNVLSTIIRRRTNVKIFMLANTVNKYSPYFKEMGLKHVKDMKPGDIDVYTYGTSELKVAVEYSDTAAKSKKGSDVYFAFDNPSLSMITGGAWEIDIYPHCPREYKPKDIVFIFFIIFNDATLQCEVIQLEDCTFLYIHEKTTPIQDEDSDIIFSTEYDPRPNHFRNIRKGTSRLVKMIGKYFQDEKVFYQDNEVGEVVRNYLLYCKNDKNT